VVLVLAPDLGDEIQGLKRGITEVCDLLVVNKLDLSEAGARQTKQRYEAALSLRSNPVPVLLTSAEVGTGIAELVAAVDAFADHALASGALGLRRSEQRRGQLRRAVEQRFRRAVESAPDRARIEAELASGELTVEQAAEALWRALR
jgi:LAO/AO transport system kinase